jgi:hypothetical protein
MKRRKEINSEYSWDRRHLAIYAWVRTGKESNIVNFAPKCYTKNTVSSLTFFRVEEPFLAFHQKRFSIHDSINVCSPYELVKFRYLVDFSRSTERFVRLYRPNDEGSGRSTSNKYKVACLGISEDKSGMSSRSHTK